MASYKKWGVLVAACLFCSALALFSNEMVGLIERELPDFYRLLFDIIDALHVLFLIKILIFSGKALCLVGLICASSIIFFHSVIKNNNLSEGKKNIIVVPYSIFIFLLFFEIIFTFIPMSHGVGYTLSAKNWRSYYWKPINNLGYRDKEIQSGDFGKKKIFILGDSLVAGHGIKKVSDRFSNLLEDKLPKNHRVFNLGKNGSDTRDEFNRLLSYPLKPDLLILQYYGNDIEGAVYAVNSEKNVKRSKLFTPYEDLNFWQKTVTKNSHLVNFLYWMRPHQDTKPYTDFLESSYNNEEILRKHSSDLYKFIEYSNNNSVPFVVVIYPFMTDISASEFYVSRIKKLFLDRNVPVLDVSNLIKEIPPNQRVINLNDGHPSVLVNQIVAKELYETIEKRNLLI